MSEADTLLESNQYQYLPEATAINDRSIIDATPEPSLENIPHNQLPHSEDTPQSATSEQTLEVATDTSADATDGEGALSTSAPATTDATADNTAITPAPETQSIALIQKLRQRNRSLLHRVTQLEQALSECHEALQSQKAKSQAQEAIIAKAAHEITISQEQITRLFRELESSHLVAQRQQILIETLTEELESSQERIAHMERECALTQQRYNQQSHQLMQAESTIRELRDRLQRQQRQTLQYKAALEKCLEVSAINYEASTEPANCSVNLWGQQHLNSIVAAPGVLPKAQPIQPWSAQPHLHQDNSSLVQPQEGEEFPNGDNIIAHKLRVCAFDPVEEHPSPVEESWVTEPWSANNDQGEMTTSDFQFQPDVEDIPGDQTHEAGIYVSIPDRDSEKTAPATTYRIPHSPSPGVFDSNENSYNGSETGTDPTQHPVETLDETSLERVEPNWPSPLVYPQRPSKGLKSLAAVELPTFPSKNGGAPSQPQTQE